MNGRPVIVHVERGRPRKAAPRGRRRRTWRAAVSGLAHPRRSVFAMLRRDVGRDYFQTPISEAFADKLAHRAEAVFARHPFWPRKAAPRGGRRRTLQAAQFQSARGRDAILTSMRHWLAGSLSSVAAHCEGRMLARERPALFRDLPESFKVGHPLPRARDRLPLRRAKDYEEGESSSAVCPRLRVGGSLDGHCLTLALLSCGQKYMCPLFRCEGFGRICEVL